MMCYRDITFCPFDACKKWSGCCWALTPEVKNAAVQWWVKGGGDEENTPISTYVEQPECFVASEEP